MLARGGVANLEIAGGRLAGGDGRDRDRRSDLAVFFELNRHIVGRLLAVVRHGHLDLEGHPGGADSQAGLGAEIARFGRSA